MAAASTAACLNWEPSSAGVRWCPLLARGVVTHLVTRFRGGFWLTTWLQTTGAALLAVKWCSLARVLMPAQDGRRARELLYFAAVLGDSHHLIRSDLHAHPMPLN